MSKFALPVLAIASALLVSCSSTTSDTEAVSVKSATQNSSDDNDLEDSDSVLAHKIIGTKAPEFDQLTWLNSEPMTMASLKGKPVFLRFWKANCPRCQETIPLLNYLYKTYSPKGLIIIGLNFSGMADPADAKIYLAQHGIKYPVAYDNDWATLKRFWAKDANYNSVSMLIDRKGIVRWLHTGGILGLPPSMGGNQESPDFEMLIKDIDKVIASKK